MTAPAQSRSRPMRVGVVGSGRMASIHAQSVHQDPRAEVVAVVNPNLESALRLCAMTGGEPVADIADLECLGVDAVIDTSPSDRHRQTVLWCAQRRVPLLLEKPLADTLAQAREVRDIVVGSELDCMVAFQRRFDPSFLALREVVASGAAGDPEHVVSISRDRKPPPEGYVPRSGGIFRDMGVHDIDMVSVLMGPGDAVARVFAQGMVGEARYIGTYGDVEEGQALLKFTSGRTAAIMLSRSAVYGYDVRMEVWGSRGAARAGYLVEPNVIRMSADGLAQATVKGFAERFAVAYREEVAAFLSHLEGGPRAGATVDEALAATVAAEACTRSLQGGRAIEVGELATA